MVNGNIKDGNIRISVTISRELHSLLLDLSKATGKSMAHMPAYVLEESRPTFEALLIAYTTAKNDKALALEQITKQAEKAMVNLAGVISDD